MDRRDVNLTFPTIERTKNLIGTVKFAVLRHDDHNAGGKADKLLRYAAEQ